MPRNRDASGERPAESWECRLRPRLPAGASRFVGVRDRRRRGRPSPGATSLGSAFCGMCRSTPRSSSRRSTAPRAPAGAPSPPCRFPTFRRWPAPPTLRRGLPRVLRRAMQRLAAPPRLVAGPRDHDRPVGTSRLPPFPIPPSWDSFVGHPQSDPAQGRRGIAPSHDCQSQPSRASCAPMTERKTRS